jgi:uncharacterized protein (DUF58 family)
MKWYLAAILILGAALVLQSGLLAFAMYVLLGVLVLTRWLARAWLHGLSAERTCPQLAAEIGDKVEVTVLVRNAGWLTVPWVLLEDLLTESALSVRTPRLKVKGKRVQLRTVSGGGETELRYTVECLVRGYYQLGPLVMESGDLFGLHRRYRVGAEPHFLVVYPRVLPLVGYDIMSRRPIGDIRMMHRLYEDPTRIAGVRQYQAGDPLNRVHWRATARTGTLHSKVYEATSLAGATLLLDFHRDGYEQRGEPFRSELAVTTVVSLVHAVGQLSQQVGLVSNGTDAADRVRLHGWQGDHRTRQAAHSGALMKDKSRRLEPVLVPTRRGAEQFQRIRETLARVELTDGLTCAQLILETAGRLPRDATLVAVLPDVPVETAIALGAMRRQGFAVTVVLILMGTRALERSYGRLLAEGIRDVRHVKDEAGLTMLCTQQVLHGPIPADGLTPYDDPEREGQPPTGWLNQRAYDWTSSEEG